MVQTETKRDVFSKKKPPINKLQKKWGLKSLAYIQAKGKEMESKPKQKKKIQNTNVYIAY